jgi:hypothetical protein
MKENSIIRPNVKGFLIILIVIKAGPIIKAKTNKIISHSDPDGSDNKSII